MQGEICISLFKSNEKRTIKMKRTKALLAALLCVFALSGCNSETPYSEQTDSVVSETSETSADSDPLDAKWENAVYKENAEIGTGAHSVQIEVKIGSKSVTLDVKSDKDNLADILTESGLAEGDVTEYGLYIKKVNGISADYDADGAYWSLCKNGEITSVGASQITISNGEHYELAYTSA